MYQKRPCDICGSIKSSLRHIRLNYVVDGIRDICDDCCCDVNDQLDKLQKISFGMNEVWLKKFIKNKKSQILGTTTTGSIRVGVSKPHKFKLLLITLKEIFCK